MRHNSIPIWLALAGASVLLTATAQTNKPGLVDFGPMPRPAEGGEFVEVNLSQNLISMAARLAEKQEPEIADALRGLHRVHVNVIGLDDTNRSEIEQRVRTLRSGLEKQGWDHVVTAQQKNQDVGVYIKSRGQDALEGVVITVLEAGRQAVLVNVAGDIRLDKLGVIAERFNIDPLKKFAGSIKKS